MSQPPTLHPTPQPPYGYRPSRSNGFAITSLVLGIISIVLCFGPLTALPGIIFGHLALSARKREPEIGGSGMAISGLIMSYFVMALTVALITAAVMSEDFREGFSESFTLAEFEPVPVEKAPFIAILPEGHDPSEPLPVAIWLHGYGSSPDELRYDETRYQNLANEKQIAIIGVCGTGYLEKVESKTGGASSYQWEEVTSIDRDHIEEVLAHHSDQVLPADGQILLFGFSQGAKVAGDVASSDPGRYRGAGIFSPGGNYDPEVDFMQDTLANQHYLVIVGAGEHEGNLDMALTFADDLREMEAQVVYRATEGQDDHTMPADEFELLSDWIDRALAAQ